MKEEEEITKQLIWSKGPNVAWWYEHSHSQHVEPGRLRSVRVSSTTCCDLWSFTFIYCYIRFWFLFFFIYLPVKLRGELYLLTTTYLHSTRSLLCLGWNKIPLPSKVKQIESRYRITYSITHLIELRETKLVLIYLLDLLHHLPMVDDEWVYTHQ